MNASSALPHSGRQPSLARLIGVAGAAVLAISVFASPMSAANQAADPSQKIEIAPFNFGLELPAGWSRHPEPTKFRPDACLLLQRSQDDTWCEVIAEELSGDVDLGQLTDGVAERFAAKATVKKQTRERVKLEGREFEHLVISARMTGMAVDRDIEYWVACENGFAWQIVFWTGGTSAERLAEEARKILDSFRVLDPGKIAGEDLGDVDRPLFGYSARWAGMGWQKSEPGPDYPLTDLEAARLYELIQVTPLRFREAPPDLEALADATLWTYEFIRETDAEKPVTWTPPYGEGMKLRRQRMVAQKQPFELQFRIVRGKHAAWIVVGFRAEDKTDPTFLTRSLDAIAFGEPEGEAPELSAAAALELADFLNQVGLSCSRRGMEPAAARWFKEATLAAPERAVYFQNLGSAYETMKLAAEGLKELAPHAERFADDCDFIAQYARLLALTGDPAAGNAAFLKIMDPELLDEGVLLSWLDLLSELGHASHAMTCARAWIAKEPSVRVELWLARKLNETKDRPAALRLLEALAAEHPLDEQVMGELGDLYASGGEHRKAAELAEKFLATSSESTRALLILGHSQMQRKLYREAKSTFERAATLKPDDEAIRSALRAASAALGE